MVDSTLSMHLAAAQQGDEDAFRELTEPYRRELFAHCYRILGSLQEAEDIVQETLLRAWRGLDTYEGRASFRAWLYKIATNACLDALDTKKRRRPPILLSRLEDDENRSTSSNEPLVWIEPFPDEYLLQAGTFSEAHYSQTESIQFAFLAILQLLPARQRAILILRDVLDFSANEVAELLDLSVSAANSTLHRARTTMRAHYHDAAAIDTKHPVDEKTQKLLQHYVQAWQAADIDTLIALLRDDAVLAMPPTPHWFRGSDSIRHFLAKDILVQPNMWRFKPTRANGQHAFGLYRRDGDEYTAFALQIVRCDEQEINHITVFLMPALFQFFGLPLQVTE